VIGYREQIESALRAAAVTSATSYAWFGRRSRPLPREVAAALAPDVARKVLIDGLQNELYRSFYTQGMPVPVRMASVPGRSTLALVEALSRANSGTGGWQHGWRVESVERDTVMAVRDGVRARVPISHCRGAHRGCGTGAQVSVRRPKEVLEGSPGFYTALGDAQPSVSRDGIELRVYLNICADGAAPLVAVCTRVLNEAGIPFELKVLDDRGGFARCDSAVLYLDDRGLERVRGSLRTIVSTCAPHLRSEPPAFAKPLVAGVAVGEHRPSLGASFGTSRCRLVAEGVAAAHESGARRLPERFEAVARSFANHGLDVDAPYLASRSARSYEL
jgi:hypothetical protein